MQFQFFIYPILSLFLRAHSNKLAEYKSLSLSWYPGDADLYVEVTTSYRKENVP